jgi:hypothetical protein
MKTILQLAWALPATQVDERLLLVSQERVLQTERCLSQNRFRLFKSPGGGWQPAADNRTQTAMLRYSFSSDHSWYNPPI